jgi:hypothetical protein
MTTIEKEWGQFRELMMSQFARLAEQAGVYISRMSNNDREVVLNTALHLAWDLREEFKPGTMTLLGFWDSCLKQAVQSRPDWRLRYFDRWERVHSKGVGGFFDLLQVLSA